MFASLVSPKLAFSLLYKERNKTGISFIALTFTAIISCITLAEYTIPIYNGNYSLVTFFLFGNSVGLISRNLILAYVMSVIISKRNETNLRPLQALPIVSVSLLPHIIGLTYNFFLGDYFEFPYIITDAWRFVIMAIGLMPLLKLSFIRSGIAILGFYVLYFLAVASFIGTTI